MSESKRKLAKLGTIVIIIIVIVVVVVAVVLTKNDDDDDKKSPRVSKFGKADMFNKAVVSADRLDCSEIGLDALKKKGSAVDAAVASLFCVGLLNMYGCGIGGGGFMNFYNRTEKKAYIYDFREAAPISAHETMYVNDSTKTASTIGGLSIAVPGNVKGLHHVWKKHGRLTWGELIDPTIKIAEEGFVISKPLGKTIERESKKKLHLNAGFKEFLQKKDGSWYKTGDTIKATKLAETFKKIKADPESFYTGDLAKEIVQDINDAGGNFSLDDLKNYRVEVREPAESTIRDFKVYTMPPPGSGTVIAMTMNILEGFNMSKSDTTDDDNLIKTTHRIIEALKFAFARRPLLGDPTFTSDVEKTIKAMLNKTFAEQLRLKIRSTPYPNQTYYGGFYSQDASPYGTSHLSVLSEDGDAVGATDTINYGFGSGVRSTRNGIIYNNEMDDFSTPGLPNLWGYLPAKANYIKPGKRPLSSMSPTIITNKDGDVVMVAGASGGSRIITAVSLTLIRTLYLEEELGKAVSDPRVHTQLLPFQVYINDPYTISNTLKQGLEKLGHKIVVSSYWSAVQAIYKDNQSNKLYAKSDPRKGGLPAGY